MDLAFQNEITALRRINHSNIVKLVDLFDINNGKSGSVIVIELVDGKEILDATNERYPNMPIPEEVALDYML